MTEPCGPPYYGKFCIKAVAIQAARDVFVANLNHLDINFKMCESQVLYDNVRKEVGDKAYMVTNIMLR